MALKHVDESEDFDWILVVVMESRHLLKTLTTVAFLVFHSVSFN